MNKSTIERWNRPNSFSTQTVSLSYFPSFCCTCAWASCWTISPAEKPYLKWLSLSSHWAIAFLSLIHISIGLPVCLEDIGVDHITEEELYQVAEKACIPEESIYACLLYTSALSKLISELWKIGIIKKLLLTIVKHVLSIFYNQPTLCPVGTKLARCV